MWPHKGTIYSGFSLFSFSDGAFHWLNPSTILGSPQCGKEEGWRMGLQDLMKNIPQRRTCRSIISRSKSIISLKSLIYITMELIYIYMSLTSIIEASICSPHFLFPLEHKKDISQPPMQLTAAMRPTSSQQVIDGCDSCPFQI